VNENKILVEKLGLLNKISSDNIFGLKFLRTGNTIVNLKEKPV